MCISIPKNSGITSVIWNSPEGKKLEKAMIIRQKETEAIRDAVRFSNGLTDIEYLAIKKELGRRIFNHDGYIAIYCSNCKDNYSYNRDDILEELYICSDCGKNWY